MTLANFKLFFDVAARPGWVKSLEGVLEDTSLEPSSLEPSKTPFLKDLQLKRVKKELFRRFGGPTWPTCSMARLWQILTFFWMFRLDGSTRIGKIIGGSGGGASSRQRAKKLAKVLKIIPRPSKTEPRSLQRKAGRKVRMPATPRSRKFSWKSVETNEANIIATVWTFLARSGGAGEVVENLSHTGPQRVGG